MNRRNFLKVAGLVPFFGASSAAGIGTLPSGADDGKTWCGKKHPLAGRKLPPWKPGEFQVHFIYTGVAESMFWILPDGTTMLLDCGDHAAWTRGKKAVWILPNGKKNAGEWIARYVTRVNPAKTAVDYMMLSHHHSDHGGGEHWGAGTREWNGQQICVSGFMQAADTLTFDTAFDRGWPDFNDPIPDERCDSNCYPLMRKVYSYLMERDGLKMEKFRVGAVNQVAMRRNAADYPSFSITNITGNGKILCRDGKVRDIASEAFDAGHEVLNVAPGGARYTIAYVTADDESMKVTGAYDFTARNARA